MKNKSQLFQGGLRGVPPTKNWNIFVSKFRQYIVRKIQCVSDHVISCNSIIDWKVQTSYILAQHYVWIHHLRGQEMFEIIFLRDSQSQLKMFVNITKICNSTLVYGTTACPKILNPLIHDFISPNGNGLRIWNSIHIYTNMCSFRMSGEQTLKVLRNRSYGQNKLSNPNSKNTQSFWKRDDL